MFASVVVGEEHRFVHDGIVGGIVGEARDLALQIASVITRRIEHRHDDGRVREIGMQRHAKAVAMTAIEQRVDHVRHRIPPRDQWTVGHPQAIIGSPEDLPRDVYAAAVHHLINEQCGIAQLVGKLGARCLGDRDREYKGQREAHERGAEANAKLSHQNHAINFRLYRRGVR